MCRRFAADGRAGAGRRNRLNHKIVVEAFDDPKVEGVTCFLSMARKGGIAGSLGLAEETSDASIACRQVGPISFAKPIATDKDGERVFEERRSEHSRAM